MADYKTGMAQTAQSSWVHSLSKPHHTWPVNSLVIMDGTLLVCLQILRHLPRTVSLRWSTADGPCLVHLDVSFLKFLQRMVSSSASQFGSRLELKSSQRVALITLATPTSSMLRASSPSGLPRLCLWDSLKGTEWVEGHLAKDLTPFILAVPLTHLASLMILMHLQSWRWRNSRTAASQCSQCLDSSFRPLSLERVLLRTFWITLPIQWPTMLGHTPLTSFLENEETQMVAL